MPFTEEQNRLLGASLDAKHVKQREGGGGRKLSYIEGWHAIAEANRIFGYDGWDSVTEDLRQLGEPYQTDKKDRNGNVTGQVWRVSWMAKVRIIVAATVREGVGYGSGIDPDIGAAHESAIKEAETDARKRALMTFGWPFGLALYDKAQEHVEKDVGTTKAETPATRSSAPSPAVAARPAGELLWVAEDGTFEGFDKPKAWFEHALRKLRSSKNPTALWATNGKVADDIVDSAGPSWRMKAEADRKACVDAVQEASNLLAAA